MAGIPLGFDFNRTSPNPIDSSMVLSKAEMLAIEDNKMPDVYFAVCKEDKQMYIYDKSATPNVTTGKFSVLSPGTTYTAGDGIDITNDVISADFATDTEIENIVTLVFGS